jgi:chromosome segregation ATPase
MKSPTQPRRARAAALAAFAGMAFLAAGVVPADGADALPAGDESLKAKCIELIRENTELRQQMRELEQQADRRARTEAPVDGDVRERLRNLEQAFAHFTEERQRLRGDNERLTAQVIEASRQMIAATNELAAARTRLAAASAEVDALKAAAREEAAARAADASRREAEMDQRAKAAASELAKRDAALKERDASIESLKAAADRARQELDQAAAARRALEEERARLAGEHAEAAAGADEARALSERLQRERALLAEQREALKGRVEALTAEQRAATERIGGLEAEAREALRLRRDLAQMYYDGGRLREADAVFRSILAKHPDDGQTHFNLAAVLLEADPPRLEEAERHYREALRLGEERDEAIEQRLAGRAPAPASESKPAPNP